MHPPELASSRTEEPSLAGTVALVTGGSRGIGKAIALAMARRNATVVVAARSLPDVEEVAAQCREFGVDTAGFFLDVSEPDSCAECVRRCCSQFGRIDVLVNNAGMATAQKFGDIDENTWSRTLNVNLTGAFHMIQAVLPGMLGRGNGRVIAINSIAGKVGAPYIAAYSAAKHGHLGLMRSLSSEYAGSGVTFNSVCPAYVDTPMTERTIGNITAKTGRSRADALKTLYTPQGRLIEPDEVANVCVFLAGPEARSINGQAINIDGGAVQW